MVGFRRGSSRLTWTLNCSTSCSDSEQQNSLWLIVSLYCLLFAKELLHILQLSDLILLVLHPVFIALVTEGIVLRYPSSDLCPL